MFDFCVVPTGLHQNGRTALIYAASDGHADCVRRLLEGGADKEATGDVRRCGADDVIAFAPAFFCFAPFSFEPNQKFESILVLPNMSEDLFNVLVSFICFFAS